MKTIVLEKNMVHLGDLLLVNRQYPMKNDASELSFAFSDFPKVGLSQEAARNLRFLLDVICAGDSIVPVSGYRSLKEQQEIYNDSLKNSGEEFTRKYVALPNHSEHQTGLAIDLALNKEDIDFICPDFPDSGVCSRFKECAADYGFILRYAKDKEPITGISHEPWHFRYVGYPHSVIMEEKGFSLEEYIDFLKNYPFDRRFIYAPEFADKVEIYYVPANDEGKTVIAIPDSWVYQISGNNIDGFIVTVWKKGYDRAQAK